MKLLKISALFFISLFAMQKSISCDWENKTGIPYIQDKAADVPTLEALPAGMELIWSDEFNEMSLDRNKWITDYYSTIDFVKKVPMFKIESAG